eukprot:TRINITY_DN8181_c0_g1_i4.p1 TRINITY_DN8181_c0_g1~~TRINITY_DN8181_c0_g1_i4.p1  ORF type:complete len:143 (-),score=16.02 TRINITY_DN8181_c0_g1_i4:127-555(-)
MGKESAHVLRMPSRAKTTRTQNNPQNIQNEFSKQWFSQANAISQFSVVEDGHVTVIIRSLTSIVRVGCAGLCNKGNGYRELVQLLVERGLIASEKCVRSISVRHNHVWEPVNPDKDTFQSSDLINIWLSNTFLGVRKQIKKW